MRTTKVCLINPRFDLPPSTDIYSKYNQPVQNTGLAFLSSVLRKEKYCVDVFECQAFGIQNRVLVQNIVKNKYDIIGISVNFFNFKNTSQVLMMLKKEKVSSYVTVGGILASTYPEQLLNLFDNITCCMIGEGELTIIELYKALSNNKSINNIEGLAYKQNSKIVRTPIRKELPVLDKLPFPDVNYISQEKMAMIINGRGCYGNCSFCASQYYYKLIYGHKKGYRNCSAKYLVHYIEHLVKNYNVKYINFADDNFLIVEERWLQEFIQGMKQMDINVSFYFSACAKDVVRYEKYLAELKECGLEVIFIGFESFVHRQLKLYRKSSSVEQNRKCIEVLKKNGIKCNAGLMLMDPFVTLDEIKENLDALEQLNYLENSYESAPPTSLISCVYVIPNTELYFLVKKENLLDSSEKGYRFLEPSVNKYYKFCLIWQKEIEKCLFVRQVLYIYRDDPRINVLNDERIALMKIDLEFMKYLCEWIKNDVDNIEICMQLYIHKLKAWRVEVRKIMQVMNITMELES